MNGSTAVIRVKVSSFFTMQKILGDGSITLMPEDSTVKGLLQELSNKHGEEFRRQIYDNETGEVKHYRIVVNGEQCNEIEAELHDGDTILLFPAMAGE